MSHPRCVTIGCDDIAQNSPLCEGRCYECHADHVASTEAEERRAAGASAFTPFFSEEL